MISKRVQNTQVPPLVEYGQLASSIEGCISLGQGAPSYKPNISFIKNYFFDNFDDKVHRYTEDPGIDKLRSLIAKKLSYDNNIRANGEDIVITPGANQAFINVLLTITDPNDSIVLLSPYYFNHKMAGTLLGLNVIEVGLNHDFTFDLEVLNAVIKKFQPKAIVLVNPGNPTGSVHNINDLTALGEIVEENNIILISDETYEYFVYEGQHISSASISALQSNTITIQSFSKTFGIPGWRLGYYHGPEKIIKESIKVQDTTAICAPAPSQYLGIQLLNHKEKLLPNFKSYLQDNYKISMDLIEEINWMENRNSKGAYYIFPKQNTEVSSLKLSKRLIHENKIYIVPGDVFGKSGENHFRISFANVNEEDLKEAFHRLKSFSL